MSARGAVLVIAAALGSACLDAGAPFLTLAPELGARYSERAERVVAPGWQKLASDYEIQVTRAELQIAGVDLHAARTTDPSFDPAHPPPGYGPCHNGHCHAPDGRLVPYEEIAADPGEAPAAPPLTLGGGAFDLLAPAAPTAAACQPSCQLGRMRLVRADVRVERLRVEGVVRDGPGVTAPVGATQFTVTLTGTPTAPLPPVTGRFDLPADNQHPPAAALSILVDLDAGLFDRVAWPDVPRMASAFDLDAPGAEAARLALRRQLPESRVAITVSRN